MEVSIEIIILLASTLSIILGGFVALYLKMSEMEVATATLTERIGHMLEVIAEDKKCGEDREKRLTIVEHITEHITDKVEEIDGAVKNIDKRLTSVELEHYSGINKHLN